MPTNAPKQAASAYLRRVPLDEAARDDDALQFVRTLADREQRRVAVVALDVELLRIAVSAVDAHRLEAVLERSFGRVKFRHARFEIAAPAAVVRARGGLDEQPRSLDARGHVGEFELDRLMLRDR